MPEQGGATEGAGALNQGGRKEPPPTRQGWNAREIPEGAQESGARSHFEAFHRDRFDYPSPKSGAKHGVLGIAGMFMFMLGVALAIAVWMNPELLPKGAALLKTAGAAVGFQYPGGSPKDADARFGISQGELPYDGNAMPDTAGNPAKPAGSSEVVSSSGNSEGSGNVAGGSAPPAAETVSAQADTDVPAKAEEVVPASVPVMEEKTASSAQAHPKQAAASSNGRKREISRLRRQAEDELYGE